MRFAYTTLIAMLVYTASFAQDTTPAKNLFGPAEATRDASDWTPTHPDGDTPIQRMLSLAYTDGLPVFDRVELYAVSMPKPFGDKKPKRIAIAKTFPVRPYNLHADIHAHTTVTGKDCIDLRTAWQSLTFDSLGGAFCHYPAYGFRFYRDDLLIFETSVCWQCQNFYLPTFDTDKQRFTHSWYGFANDDHAEQLLKFLRHKLPHPKLPDTVEGRR